MNPIIPILISIIIDSIAPSNSLYMRNNDYKMYYQYEGFGYLPVEENSDIIDIKYNDSLYIELVSPIYGMNYDTITYSLGNRILKTDTFRIIGDDINNTLAAWDFMDYIHYSDSTSLDTIRDYLYRNIFITGHDSTFLNHTVDSVWYDTTYYDCSAQLSDLNYCSRIDLLRIDIDSSFNYCYVYNAENPNDSVIILHYGHDGQGAWDVSGFDDAIDLFLSHGFHVITLNMTNYACNSSYSDVTYHDYSSYENDTLNPLIYFVAPSICIINYIIDSLNINNIFYVGHSGGGWTSCILGAMDTRIDKVIDNSGNTELTIQNSGDWEMKYANIYDDINYVDLYSLAAQYREYYQLRNTTDSYSYLGKWWWTMYTYELQNYMNNLEINGIIEGFSYTYITHYFPQYSREKTIELIRR